MTETIEVSVIIACFNGASTLQETLDGITSQVADCRWEVVFADNGSTDSSAAIFDAHARKHGHIPMRRVDASQVRGKSHALNVAITVARSDKLVFCDADDVPAEGWLAAMARALEDHEFVAAGDEYDHLNPPWALEYRNIRPGRPPSLHRISYPPYCDTATGNVAGMRRSVFETVGPFEVGALWHEDIEFSIRAYNAGYRVVLVPDARVHIRVRTDPAEIFRQAHKFARGRAMLHEKFAEAEGRGSLAAMMVLRPWIALGRRFARLALTRGKAAVGKPMSPLEYARFQYRLGTATGDLAGAIACRVAPPDPYASAAQRTDVRSGAGAPLPASSPRAAGSAARSGTVAH